MTQPLPRRRCFDTLWPPRGSHLQAALRTQRPHHRWIVDVGFEANCASIPKRPHVCCRDLVLFPGGSGRPSRMAHGYDMITGIKVSVDFNLGVNRLGLPKVRARVGGARSPGAGQVDVSDDAEAGCQSWFRPRSPPRAEWSTVEWSSGESECLWALGRR